MAIFSRKRDTNARSTPLSHPASHPRFKRTAMFVAAPLALVATAAAVTVGVVSADPATRDLVATQGAASINLDERRDGLVSRSESRSDSRTQHVAKVRPGVTLERMYAVDMSRSAVARAIDNADTVLWTTAVLNLWTTPGDDAAKDGLIDAGKKVLVTGRSAAGRDEVVVGGAARWVSSGYLAEDKPEPEVEEETAGSSGSSAPAVGASCTNGSSVESGVSPNIVAVHAAVCAAFPEITIYGTFRGDGEHAQGIAVDIMVSGSRGSEVAEFVRAHAGEFGVNYLIYSQQIWSVDRAGEGWRGMEDRGSTTANHYDHVHVTTY